MEKMTITERINAIDFANLSENDFDFLKERALKSVRKSNGERKATKVQVENEGIKGAIVEFLGSVDGATATAIAEALGLSSNQKASALLTQLIKSGDVVKVKDGKVTLFKVA